MDWGTWAAVAAAYLGAGLSFLATRAGVRQRERGDRRAEWGRRLQFALGQLSDGADPARRFIGRTMLESLATSGLATTEDRALATAILIRELREGDPRGQATHALRNLDDPDHDRHNENDAGGAR